MKKILATLSITANIYAATGVVKALEIPILIAEDESSSILQMKRLGEKIHIHDNSLDSDSDYYLTLTRDGREAYVSKKFIKIIRKNIQELETNIALENDPTDYRLDEPMPESYPFKIYSHNKALIGFNYGQGTVNTYEYGNQVTREQFNPTLALDIRYLRNPSFDKTDRVYYGLHFGGQTERNEVQVTENVFSQESHMKLFIGPSFLYTFYRRNSFEIDFNVDASFNYQRSFVSQERTSTNESEEREFSGTFISMKMGANFIHRRIFDTPDLDFYHGPQLSINSPYTLTTSTPAEIAELWPSDTFNIQADFALSYSLGFTVRY
ncbi:hypothetical protein [Bacteriovorax sp. Seq25_V]|uniref:hypothetical protein n=1 Tax=Bacteriovorax sp. Seq25_V TaxID=1201288 RepID=UPI00038A2612|nr:hypothetical protein [Bacteriovorax sp. Seq25_V]EQC44671.1 hypothetical protein M900_0393 [Bacteriovorax sp. Seq25_V]